MARVFSFTAEVALTPRLSVGTAEPESIYEATFKRRSSPAARALDAGAGTAATMANVTDAAGTEQSPANSTCRCPRRSSHSPACR